MADKLLQETVNNIKSLREDADLPVENWDPRTKAGIAMRQRAAAESLPVALEGYKKLLAARMLSILVAGPGAGKFSEIASAEFDCISVPADALYRDLADKVAPSLRTGEQFSIEQVLITNVLLEDVGKKLGIAQMPAPQMTGDLVVEVRDRETLISLIQTAIERAVGGDLNRMYVIDAATTKAANGLYDLPVLPVVLPIEKTAAFIPFSDKTFTVGIGTGGDPNELVLSTVTKDSVKSALVAAQQKFGIGEAKRSHKKKVAVEGVPVGTSTETAGDTKLA